MPAATRIISVRLPEPLLKEAASLRPNAKVSEMVLEAFVAWVDGVRRQYEDDLIRQALESTSPQQRKDEKALAKLAGRSSVKALEQTNG